jgi:predicted metalloprotease with PDZ domain
MLLIGRTALLLALTVSALPAQVTRVRVDASSPAQRLLHSSITMPVKAGPLTLLYPQWIPGDHQPVGPIADLAGLKISASGTALAWSRDTVDMYAFHLDVPQGVDSLDIRLDLILAPEAIGVDSSSFSTPQLLVLNWYPLLLYPKGTPANRLNYQAQVTLPAGWKFGTALPLEKEAAGTLEFQPCSLTTLVDSPVIAGRYVQTYDLNPGAAPPQFVHVAADSAHGSELAPEYVAGLRKLVKEEAALFGPGHFRSYHFLLAMTDHGLPFAGLEHHESSDNRLTERALQSDGSRRYTADLLPHEMAHSWNGKFRRPSGLATADYSEPQKGDLLWVYEGLTDYVGRVLASRSGLRTAEDFRDELAQFADYLENQAGRAWRPLEDTAVAVQTTFFGRDDYAGYRRGADYYNEGTLIWLEADTLIRRQSKGAKSLDDFCRAFVAGPAGMPSVKPYGFDEVVATLNSVQPYDWAGFLTTRIRKIAPQAPLGGITGGGWKLVYGTAKPDLWKFHEDFGKSEDLLPSLGLLLKEDGRIADVAVNSKAYAAGIAPATKLLAVNGRQYTPDVLHEALQDAAAGTGPIEMLVKNGDFYTTHRVDYHGGDRYPRLEREAGSTDLLTEITKPRAR